MKGKTHVVIGAAVAVVLLNKYNVESRLILVGASMLGSLIPDIDHPKSIVNKRILPIKNKLFKIIFYCVIGIAAIYIGQENDSRLFIFTGITSFFVGVSSHRSFTHSLFGYILFCVVSYLITIKYNVESAYIGLILGYGLHLIADFFTKDGIKIFYPYNKRIRAPITVSTGGIVEYILFINLGIYLFYNIIRDFKLY